MSSAQRLRSTVEQSRDSVEPSPLAASFQLPRDVRAAMELITKLSEGVVKPGFSLESFLSEQGFQKPDDDVNDSDSSFSFNFGDMSSSSMGLSMSPTSMHSSHKREKKKIGTAMSSKIAHHSWAINHSGAAADNLIDDDPKSQLLTVYTAATIMFIDLSGYSKITAALANSGGAHALSAAVNGYFGAILAVVDRFEGDVISFAGDAICVCWPAKNTSEANCAVKACACALDLQLKCGMSPLPGTDLAFRLHIGITHGDIQSEILVSRTNENMQAAYHFVSGPPLIETAAVVDGAKVGEVCITNRVRSLCGPKIECKAAGQEAAADADADSDTIFLLTHVDEDDDDLDNFPNEAESLRRLPWLDDSLVPPAIQRKLRQGFKPEHLAEMRFLCVLFVKKVYEEVSAKEWFSEVQYILDDCRCPIVQLIHDDKGTHLIAAVNLFVTERCGADTAIGAARRLQERETGCVVGVACGEVFCGLTGSSDVSCRWDITGPACVRACRLMQYAVEKGHQTVIDETIYKNTSDTSQLNRIDEAIVVKGSADAVTAYTLSPHSIAATAGIISTSWLNPSIHREAREVLQASLLKTNIQKGVVIIDGPIGCGKKTVIVRSLEESGFTKLIHFATRDVRPLSIIKTVAEWFIHHKDEDLAAVSQTMLSALSDVKLTRTLSLFHKLVESIIKKNISFCLVIAYANLLDNPSFNLISSIITSSVSNGNGRFLFALTVYPMYGTKTSAELSGALQWSLNNARNSASLNDAKTDMIQKEVTTLEVGYPETSTMFSDAFSSFSYFHLHEKAAVVLHEATGGCLLLVRPLLVHMNTVFFNESPQRTDLMPLTRDGLIHLTAAGEDYMMSQIYWPSVAPAESSRFMELYDQLPPKYQLILRVIASLSTTSGAASPYHVAAIIRKLNPRIVAEKVIADIKQLAKLKIIRGLDQDGGEYQFSVPAMLDVVGSLLTPDQDRTLKRQAFLLAKAYHDGDGQTDVEPIYMPIFTSFIAKLARAADDMNAYKNYLVRSWTLCLEQTRGGSNPDLLDRMEERMASECRQYPHLVSDELFASCPTRPQLRDRKHVGDLTCEGVPPMPNVAKFLGVSFYPPISLGALSGELQLLAWGTINNYLDLTKPAGHSFVDETLREQLKINVDRYIETVKSFEEKVPLLAEEFPSPLSDVETFDALNEIILPLSLNEERQLIEELQVKPATVELSMKQCNTLFAYCIKVMIPRRFRFLEFVKSLDGESVKKILKPDDPVSRALLRFADVEKRTSLGIHEALLDLATEGWAGKYYNLNLQGIRDQIFKQHSADITDFVAMLVSFKMFGDSISF